MTPRTPTTELDPRLLERVRALLAKAESTAFEAEAQAFTAKAHELMARHRLERAVLDDHPPPGSPEARDVALVEPYVGIKAELLAAVAHACGVQAVRHRGRPLVTLVGFTSDLAATDVLFTSLLVQAQSALDGVGAQAPPGSPVRSRGFRSSFLRGYARRVAARLDEARTEVERDVEASAPGALVPVLARRDAEVRSAVRERFPRLGTVRAAAPTDARGYRAGVAAAERADLGRERLGAAARPLTRRSTRRG